MSLTSHVVHPRVVRLGSAGSRPLAAHVRRLDTMVDRLSTLSAGEVGKILVRRQPRRWYAEMSKPSLGLPPLVLTVDAGELAIRRQKLIPQGQAALVARVRAGD